MASHKKTKKHASKKAKSHAHNEPKDHKPAKDAEPEVKNQPADVESELRTIYALDADTPDQIDMSKLEIVKQPIVRRVLVAALLVLIAVGAGVTGALLLNNPFQQGQSQVLTFDVDVDPEAVVAGQPATITIPYQNPSNVPLAELEVQLHVPESFRLTSITPEPIDTDPFLWEVGTVAPKERGELVLEGVFWDTPGNAVTLQSITRYAPANFSSPFEDIESASVLIEESVLATSVDGPDRAVPGESVSYTIAVERTEIVQETVELQLELPEGFTITSSSEPTQQEGIPRWVLPETDTTDTYTLEIEGTFASDVQGPQPLTAHAGVVLEEAFINQSTTVFETDVLASDFSLSLIANGQTNQAIVLPGDDITLNVALNNRGEEVAQDITIELFVDNGVDRVNLAERSGIPNGDVYGNKINWDQTDMNRLDTLRGGEDASIDVAIPTREDGSTTVRLHAEAVITTVGDIEINRQIISSDLTIRIASNLSAAASARYYDSNGSPIGSGPMPPEVGQETTYRITWTAVNALNDVEDAVMVASIPSDASWGGLVQTSDGTVTYDSVANRVRWSIGDIPAGASPPIAVFDMKVNPSAADLGTFLDLLGTATITAIDTTTDSTVSANAPGLTSELPNDSYAENQGIVVE